MTETDGFSLSLSSHSLPHIVMQNHHQWLNTHLQLLQTASQVDYDVDSYSQRLEEVLSDQMDHLQKLRIKVASFRTQLLEEEQISKNIVKRKK